MKKTNLFIYFLTYLMVITGTVYGQKQIFPSKARDGQETMVDTRVDNMKYWRSLADMGLVSVQPVVQIEEAKYKGSGIEASSVVTENSPDVPVTAMTNVTESENSIFVDPNNDQFLLNSNNSTSWSGGSVGTLYGANYFISDDGGSNWGGSHLGAGGSNSGDPTTAISLDGRMYVGFINNSYGQSVAYSTDGGLTWTSKLVANATGGGGILDKNHLWIDNSPVSPHAGNLYDAWTDFGGSINDDIGLSRSTDGGLTWSTPVNVSGAVNAGSHCQGVNIQTGPNGEVYVAFAIYDNWPQDEKAIGFTKSTNGGATFSSATRIITNIRGIRSTETSKNHRVNSFPSMAVDISGGPYNGYIYIVWTNIGVPGVNTGNDKDVYLIRSTDQGATWSPPVRVNQDPASLGKEHYFPWITCDPVTGGLSVVFYDDRNVSSTKCEVYAANSFDGGMTWEDFKVSDVEFTPSPIPGLAGGYMGDYLGISARGSYVYPTWTDNRGGLYMTYVSPYVTNNLPKPYDLNITLNENTGQVDLDWSFDMVPGFLYFNVYRDDILLGNTTDLFWTDNLPTYGVFSYKVTAMHQEGESVPVSGTIQWGNAQIAFNPAAINAVLEPGASTVKTLTLSNVGELDLIWDLQTEITSDKGPEDYCTGSGGCDEFISKVVLGDINNSSGCDGYADYTNLSTLLELDQTYSITVENGNVYSSDDLGVWIDWNQDGDWEEPDEEVVCEVDNSGQGTYSFTVPSSALAGETRMRVRIKYFGSDCGDPCGQTTYGEVEDYKIIVQGWIQVEPKHDTIQPGNSQAIQVSLDASDLTQGVYTANLNITSNDPDNPLIVVPVTLTVGQNVLQVTVTATPSTICSGETSQLAAEATGGTGTYTYQWTSNPPGFTSTQQNPTVSPTITTTYTVEVYDGQSTATDQVAVTVDDVPVPPGAPTGPSSLCENSINTTYNTSGSPGATSYVWVLSPAGAGIISGSGQIGIVDWSPTFTGQASVTVKGVNNCGEGDPSSPLVVTIHPLPTVTLDPFDTVCINTPAFPLTGGSPDGGTYSGPAVSNGYFDPAAAGLGLHTITYTYTDPNGCENFAEANIFVDACTGLYEVVDGLHVEVFPNPNGGEFTIRLRGLPGEEVNVGVVNSLGRTVWSLLTSHSGTQTMHVDLSGEGQGLYMLRLESPHLRYMTKIILNR
ncbi:MAG: T9SS type A sorting domain-containing protein [Bacteroidales bacterium]|nr:T9SS type A sorting domain-containing protein [Bacteroidales bacterium]